MYSCCGSLTVAVPNFIVKVCACSVVPRQSASPTAAAVDNSRRLSVMTSPLGAFASCGAGAWQRDLVHCTGSLLCRTLRSSALRRARRHAEHEEMHAFRRDQRL